jgi:hypothetical protein
MHDATATTATTATATTKAEHFSQFREAFKNCSSELFYPRELAKLRGYTSCFVVAVVVACLLVLYSMKQFDNLTLQQGSHARMQFGILPLQQGNSRRVHAVWYPATALAWASLG